MLVLNLYPETFLFIFKTFKFNEIKLIDDVCSNSFIPAKIRRSKIRSKTTIIPSTENLDKNKASSSTITASSISSTVSSVVFSGQSAFKPFKSITSQIPVKKDDVNLNNLIIKTHLEGMICKKDRKSLRRTKSESCINNKDFLVKKNARKSMPNIIFFNKKDEPVEIKDNILLINNFPKIFIKPRGLLNSSTTSTASTTTTSRMKLNTEIAKTKLSMLRFPCSLSLYDLLILVFRLKDTCCNLVKFLIPPGIEKINSKFFEAKFQTVLCVYRVREKKFGFFYLRNLFF